MSGFNAVVGRPVAEYGFEPARFDEMRRGAWDIHARVKDMDLNGVYASLNFPSFLPGFAGQRLQQVTEDRDLAMASVRAWNDWHIEAWAGAYPDRIIPCQLPWLLDPEVGAKMIYENAERGFHAVTFSENPAMLGLPTHPLGLLGPVHGGLRGHRHGREPAHRLVGHVPVHHRRRPARRQGVLFFAYAISAAVDWLYSRMPSRFPDLKICLSEGGIGWVPGCSTGSTTCSATTRCTAPGALGETLTPAEVLSATSGSAPWRTLVVRQRDRIGVENIPPRSRLPALRFDMATHPAQTIHEQITAFPSRSSGNDVGKRTRLYQHPVPEAVRQIPNTF